MIITLLSSTVLVAAITNVNFYQYDRTGPVGIKLRESHGNIKSVVLSFNNSVLSNTGTFTGSIITFIYKNGIVQGTSSVTIADGTLITSSGTTITGNIDTTIIFNIDFTEFTYVSNDYIEFTININDTNIPTSGDYCVNIYGTAYIENI